MKIKIEHQVDKKEFEFEVKNPKSLTKKEVKFICKTMNVQALFVEGRYYKGGN